MSARGNYLVQSRYPETRWAADAYCPTETEAREWFARIVTQHPDRAVRIVNRAAKEIVAIIGEPEGR